jgi:hypothetical protein
MHRSTSLPPEVWQGNSQLLSQTSEKAAQANNYRDVFSWYVICITEDAMKADRRVQD